MRLIEGIIRFFWNMGNARSIKNDPQRGPKSFRYAVKSMICIIFAVPVAALIAVMPVMNQGAGGILILFWIAILAAGIAGTVILVLGALFNWFLQLYINRNPVTWVSLAVLLAGLVGVALVVFWAVGLF